MFERVDLNRTYWAPQRSYKGDAGYDLFLSETIELHAGEILPVRFNVRAILPYGWFGLIQERSSIGRLGVHTVGNVIDEGYSGEFGAILHNLTQKSLFFGSGTKIAQFIPMKRWIDSNEDLLPKRGQNGFGSSGR